MSVYTVIERGELESFLEPFELGRLEDFDGITAGMENTNYFVTTSAGRFVLTIFEFTPDTDLPYFLDLMAYLADHGIASPHPIADRRGRYLQRIGGKPAALVRRLEGASVEIPRPEHCAAMGEGLAAMHAAARGFPAVRANDRGVEWQVETAERVLPGLSAPDAALLREALAGQRDFDSGSIPEGVIHADLFRDNALFAGHELTGIVDFYYAHNGPLIYDLAVTVADWCFDDLGRFDRAAARELAGAYGRVRPISAPERAAWPHFVRTAGLRFWLSRLQDRFFPRAGSLTHIKDPEPFRQVLLAGSDPGAPVNCILE